MKKLFSAVLVAGITLSGVGATSADAATGKSIQNVKQLQQGDNSLESAKIGASIQTDLNILIDLIIKNITMNLRNLKVL